MEPQTLRTMRMENLGHLISRVWRLSRFVLAAFTHAPPRPDVLRLVCDAAALLSQAASGSGDASSPAG